MATADAATITVSRAQIRAAFGEWHAASVAEGQANAATPPDDDTVDYFMYLLRNQGAH